MQKVEGSSPFIRFAEPAGNGGFSSAARRLIEAPRRLGQVSVQVGAASRRPPQSLKRDRASEIAFVAVIILATAAVLVLYAI